MCQQTLAIEKMASGKQVGLTAVGGFGLMYQVITSTAYTVTGD